MISLKNKDTDQLRHLHIMLSSICCYCLNNTISTLAITKFSKIQASPCLRINFFHPQLSMKFIMLINNIFWHLCFYELLKLHA